jgi:hypothetical protein
VWDPWEGLVVVQGGYGKEGHTWGLRLGDDPEWITLRHEDASPPTGVRAMGIDPQGTIYEITDDDDGDGLAVFRISLSSGGDWERVTEIPFAPSTKGELLYDPHVCGFHILTARRTRCVLEHWILTRDGELVDRGETDLDPPHFIAASTYVAAADELVVYSSEDCDEPGDPNPVVHRVPLVR